MIYTQAEMKTVWRMLNDLCFASKLDEPTFTCGPAEFEDPVFGVYYPDQERIHIDSNLCTNVGALLATMAHEMIHQWQDQTNRPVNHGNLFRSKAAEIKRRTGLVC